MKKEGYCRKHSAGVASEEVFRDGLRRVDLNILTQVEEVVTHLAILLIKGAKHSESEAARSKIKEQLMVLELTILEIYKEISDVNQCIS